jgi:hypothetical protein
MRCISLLAITVVLSSGCHLGPRWNRQLELLNAEKRSLEDELYALQYDLEDAANDVKELKRENDRLRQRLGLSPAESPIPDRPPPPRGSGGPALTPPVIEERTLQEPRIEIPEDRPASEGGKPKTTVAPLPSPASTSLPTSESPRTLPSLSGLLEPSDPRVTHIYLNPLLTGGSDFNREPGDDGLVVVIEPRNRSDEFVPIAGPISVVLLDPARDKEQARFARWEIDAPNAQRSLEQSTKIKGIHLRLPWPESLPTSSRMHLYVRYVTVDGRKLEADREIFLALPGQMTQRWTPRSTTPESRPGAAREVLPAAYHAPHRLLPADVESELHEKELPSEKASVARGGQTPTLPEWKPYRPESAN